MIRVGIAGMGFMGWIHWLAYRATPGIRVTALCTLEPERLQGDWRGIRGNFGPPGEVVDVSGLGKFERIEGMLADPSIDLIDICLPPHLHAEVSIRALNAGKHVFCEKPMALTPADCERMIEAARKADRQLFVAHVLPFFPEYAHARQLISEGRYGGLRGGSFKRIIADPPWLKEFYNPAHTGGPLLDLHVHDAHLIRLLFGMPASVACRGRMRGEVVEYVHAAFGFSDPSLVVSAESGVVGPQGRSFTHGFEIHLQKATLQYEFAVFDGKPRLILPLTICDDGGRVLQPSLGDGDPVRAFEAEIAELARSLESGRPSPLLSGDLARDAVRICQKETESVVGGRPATLAS